MSGCDDGDWCLNAQMTCGTLLCPTALSPVGWDSLSYQGDMAEVLVEDGDDVLVYPDVAMGTGVPMSG